MKLQVHSETGGKVRLAPGGSESHLLNRDLYLVDRRLLDLRVTISRLLNLSLHVDDGFPVEVTSPSNHVARNLSLLFGEDGLDSRNSLPEDKEHDM